jgi:hypothetical protein
MAGGITETSICPYAHGFIPQELICKLRVEEYSGLPWWTRLGKSLGGAYNCMTDGELPCPVLADYNKRKQEGK